MLSNNYQCQICPCSTCADVGCAECGLCRGRMRTEYCTDHIKKFPVINCETQEKEIKFSTDFSRATHKIL